MSSASSRQVRYDNLDKPRPEPWINEVGVAPSHRGRGLGKALMGAMLELGRRLGCAEAWALIERASIAAMQLCSAPGGLEGAKHHVMFTFRLDDDGATVAAVEATGRSR